MLFACKGVPCLNLPIILTPGTNEVFIIVREAHISDMGGMPNILRVFGLEKHNGVQLEKNHTVKCLEKRERILHRNLDLHQIQYISLSPASGASCPVWGCSLYL